MEKGHLFFATQEKGVCVPMGRAAYQNAHNISSCIKLEPGAWLEKRICIACHRFVGGLLVGRDEQG